MKNYSLFFIFSLLICYSCNKEENLTPEERLPPASQTGKGIFAGLVNGELFNDTNGGYFNCYYQFVDGGYYFGVGGDDDNSLPSNIYLKMENIVIEEGKSYNLVEDDNKSAYAGAGFVYSPTNSYITYTDSNYSGELKITKFDRQKRIVSGTFWFDLKHPVSGDTVKVRQGRFDTLFTQ